ncbi:hypothetical protein QTP88_026449 [Uroleucon formosanum]
MLSSTSNSPLHEGKKTKTFISPNRFAVLASDVTGDDPVFDTAPSFRDDTVVSSPHSMDHQTEPPAPPLYIRNIINFSAFKNVLIKTVGLDGFTCKSTPSYLIVRPNGRDNFNALANYLVDTNASFHTFRPPIDRPFRISSSMLPLFRGPYGQLQGVPALSSHSKSSQNQVFKFPNKFLTDQKLIPQSSPHNHYSIYPVICIYYFRS